MDNLTLTKTPARNTSAGNVSVWGAAFNPLVFNYQRRDYEVFAVNVLSENEIQLQIYEILTPEEAGALIDSFIKLKTANYDDILLVESTNIVPPAGLLLGWTEIVLYSPGHAVADTIGYMNSDLLHASWQVRSLLKINNKLYTMFHSADRDGIVRADLSGVIKEFVSNDDYFKYDQFNYFDSGLSIKYSVQYRWEYQDVSGASFAGDIESAGDFYAANSALQLGNALGSNMGAYVPFLVEPNTDRLAKWLTVFDEPVFNIGFPFDLSFIYSEKLAGKNMYVKFIPLDINRQPLANGGGFQDVMLAINVADDLAINDTNGVIVSNNISESGYRELIEGIGICRINFTDLFSDRAKYVNIYAYYQTGAAASIHWELTEPATGPSYVDVDLVIYQDGTPFVHAGVTSENDFDIPAGRSITFSGASFGPSTAANPKMTMIVTKNDIIVYAQTVAVSPGVELKYDVTTDFDASYSHSVVGHDGGEDVTPVNIPDTITGESSGEHIVTETKTIQICRQPVCKDKFIYMKWLNLIAGWEYQLFTYDIDDSLEVADRIYYDVPVLDYETQRETENVLFTSARDTYGLSKIDLKPNQLRGLSSMDYSPKAYMLTSLQPYAWLGATVDAKSQTRFNSNDGLGVFTKTIKLPNKNLQF